MRVELALETTTMFSTPNISSYRLIPQTTSKRSSERLSSVCSNRKSEGLFSAHAHEVQRHKKQYEHAGVRIMALFLCFASTNFEQLFRGSLFSTFDIDTQFFKVFWQTEMVTHIFSNGHAKNSANSLCYRHQNTLKSRFMTISVFR